MDDGLLYWLDQFTEINLKVKTGPKSETVQRSSGYGSLKRNGQELQPSIFANWRMIKEKEGILKIIK